MPYIGAGVQRFNTADNLTVTGTSELKNNVTVTGDVTASGTVLPTGDTAAGDAAALGFTSTEGLILTGQGSTSDVVIKNDADTTVCFVPTGTDDLKFNDTARIIMGAGDDLQIIHDGSNSIVSDNGTGNLVLRSDAAAVEIDFNTDETSALFNHNGSVELYHDNTKKFETTSDGVTVTGDATFTNSDAGTIIARVGTNVAGVKTSSGDDFCVGTADHTQAIRIKNADGHVGIGNTAPSCQLHVNADDDDEVLQVHADSSSYTSNVIYVQTTKAANTDHRYFKANENDGSATSIQILGNGNVQNANNSYGSISDQRIKQDVTDANSQWADIKALNFKNYKEKYRVSVDGDDAPVLLGLIAQDLETTGMNGLVETVEPDPYQKDTLGIEEDVKAVKYSVLYMKAVKALQEAMTRIETLETEMTALKARVTALEDA